MGWTEGFQVSMRIFLTEFAEGGERMVVRFLSVEDGIGRMALVMFAISFGWVDMMTCRGLWPANLFAVCCFSFVRGTENQSADT